MNEIPEAGVSLPDSGLEAAFPIGSIGEVGEETPDLTFQLLECYRHTWGHLGHSIHWLADSVYPTYRYRPRKGPHRGPTSDPLAARQRARTQLLRLAYWIALHPDRFLALGAVTVVAGKIPRPRHALFRLLGTLPGPDGAAILLRLADGSNRFVLLSIQDTPDLPAYLGAKEYLEQCFGPGSIAFSVTGVTTRIPGAADLEGHKNQPIKYNVEETEIAIDRWRPVVSKAFREFGEFVETACVQPAFADAPSPYIARKGQARIEFAGFGQRLHDVRRALDESDLGATVPSQMEGFYDTSPDQVVERVREIYSRTANEEPGEFLTVVVSRAFDILGQLALPSGNDKMAADMRSWAIQRAFSDVSRTFSNRERGRVDRSSTSLTIPTTSWPPPSTRLSAT